MRLVTGGSGFIGRNLDGDVKMSKSNADLRSFNETLNSFKKLKPSTIVNCASKFGNYLDMQKDFVEHFTDNMLINMNVYKAALMQNVKRMITLSSITAFPTYQFTFGYNSLPSINEEHLHMGEVDSSCYTSGYAKRMIDVLSRSYNDTHDVNYICTFLTNTYGQHFKVNNGTIPYLIYKCYDAKINNTDLILSGDGSQLRDFIYVKDVNEIINWLLDNYKDNSPIIISTNNVRSIKEITEIITKIMKFKRNIIWKPSDNVGQHIKICNNNKLRTFYPEFKFTCLEDGIYETVEWFYQNKSNYGF